MRILGISGRLTATAASLLIAAVGGGAVTASAAAGTAPGNAPAARLAGGGLRAAEHPAAGAGLAPGSFLFGVYCTSSHNCWAVGYTTTSHAYVNQALHWNGSAWKAASVPNPGGRGSATVTPSNELFAVRCRASADCWAVGQYSTGTNKPLRNEALHWNGSKWKIVATPDPGGAGSSDESELYDVTCTSSANCWAVGDYGRYHGTIVEPVRFRNQVLHWNGSKWSQMQVPNPAGTTTGHQNSLISVRCRSSASCFAVGDYGTTGTSLVVHNQALRWNGSKWKLQHTPNPSGAAATHVNLLESLGCETATLCFAAGEYGTGLPVVTAASDQILRWNGTRWYQVGTPKLSGASPLSDSELFGTVCVTARNCWTVGSYTNTASALVNQALHWTGKKWFQVPTPNPGGSTTSSGFNTLISARCTSTKNCWAVGYDESTTQGGDEILHWNGAKWSVYNLAG